MSDIERDADRACHCLTTLRWPSVRVPHPREVAAVLLSQGVAVAVEIDTTGPPVAPVYGYLRLAVEAVSDA